MGVIQMNGLYLGVNDNNRSTRSLTSFWRNLRHVGREKNSQDYAYKDKEFINIVEDYREETKQLLRVHRDELKKVDEISKSDLSNSISKYTYKLKTYEKELDKLNRDLLFTERDSKEYISVMNKIKRKDKTIFSTKEKINSLKEEHSKVLDLSKQPKNIFNELVFDLTSLDEKFWRDPKFGKLMLEDFKIYVKDKFPNMDLTMLACHMDQNGPHIHVCGVYLKGSMFDDLKKSFGVENQFKQLQQDFLKYVRESNLVKKYDLKINDLKENEVYIDKQDLKLIELHAKQKTIKDLEKYKAINNKDEIIKDLRQQLYKANKQLLLQKKKTSLALKEEEKQYNKAQRFEKLNKISTLPLEAKVQELSTRNIELIKKLANTNNLKEDMAQRMLKQSQPLQNQIKQLQLALKQRDEELRKAHIKIQDLEQEHNHNMDRD